MQKDRTAAQGPPPQAQLMQMVQSIMVAKSLSLCAQLKIADHLEAGVRHVGRLAEATQSHPGALHRVLRALASVGVFAETDEGVFDNTPLSSTLRSDVTGSIRDYVSVALHDGNMRAWTRLDNVVKSGRSSFESENGAPYFEYLAQNPDVGESFDRAMSAMSQQQAMLLPQMYDFSQHKSLVDVGGGRGHMLAGILDDTPALSGVVYDRPPVVERARSFLAERGLSDRSEAVGGDFFESVPAGHDAYLIKQTLHDFDDDAALRIMKNVRTAISDAGTLLLVEGVIRSGNAPDPAKWLDVHMMVALGGRERSEPEHRALLERAGFGLERIVQLPGPTDLLIAKPATG